MALLREKIPNNCLPFSESYQNVLATVLLLLGLLVVLDNAIKVVLLIWRYLRQFPKRTFYFFITKGDGCLKTLKALYCSKKCSTWKDLVLTKGCRKMSSLRFHCTVDPLQLTVNVNHLNGLKNHDIQGDKKSKGYQGPWPPGHQNTDDDKASWYGYKQHPQANCQPNQEQSSHGWDSQSSSPHSDSDSPQPVCPPGSTVSLMHSPSGSRAQLTKTRCSLADWSTYARDPQSATGDKRPGLDSAGEAIQGQSFLNQPAGPSTEEPTAARSECSAAHVRHQVSETPFIPSPILPGPKRVVYSALTPNPESGACLNNCPHSAPPQRSPKHHSGPKLHQGLPLGQKARLYVYLVNPQPPHQKHTAVGAPHDFSASRTVLAKDLLGKQASHNRPWEGSKQGSRGQGICDPHMQRKSIWERKRQASVLQSSPGYEKLVGSSSGTNMTHEEPYCPKPPILVDRTRGSLASPAPRSST
ncbi:uncharacterized protein LOC102571559 [Alligator mississippiensis]|uniref:Uncharacterized protein n=1 Tax=Alligator mississippiensis TaxID=8496 RepID=A0A151NYV0_ALLMI|nr:uncharacterized protein LOC102571559 [Alligator mississippiensis]KYO42052.1 hypothetical protein Y1Q_0002699 [Alligator mississippiensis]